MSQDRPTPACPSAWDAPARVWSSVQEQGGRPAAMATLNLALYDEWRRACAGAASKARSTDEVLGTDRITGYAARMEARVEPPAAAVGGG